MHQALKRNNKLEKRVKVLGVIMVLLLVVVAALLFSNSGKSAEEGKAVKNDKVDGSNADKNQKGLKEKELQAQEQLLQERQK